MVYFTFDSRDFHGIKGKNGYTDSQVEFFKDARQDFSDVFSQGSRVYFLQHLS